jgi:hypothetical protein
MNAQGPGEASLPGSASFPKLYRKITTTRGLRTRTGVVQTKERQVFSVFVHFLQPKSPGIVIKPDRNIAIARKFKAVGFLTLRAV